MDYGGRWGWDKFENLELKDLIIKLIDFSAYNIPQLKKANSHLVSIDKLVKDARNRIVQIEQDDLGDLFSLRLSGKKRIWCIKDKNILKILWWDPNHEVCPSHKKNT